MPRLKAIVLSCALMAVLLFSGLIEPLFLRILDWRNALSPRAASGEIVVVAIDPSSVRQIGIWPWPRSLHATLIEKLEAAGVSEIAFDVDFSSASNQKDDEIFAGALKKTGASIILPAFIERLGERNSLINALPEFQKNTWSGIVNVRPGHDGAIRVYSVGEVFEGKFLPSLAASIAGSSAASPDVFFIDHGISTAAIPTVSYVDIIDGVPAALAAVKGKKIIVGATALELGDRVAVPFGKIVAGPLLQAVAADALYQNRALHRFGHAKSWIIAAVLALLVILTWRRISHRGKGSLVISAAVIAEGAAFLIQRYYPVAWDTAPIWLATGVLLTALMLDELDLRAFVGRIAENRFKRLTMSLGDALICTDSRGVITMTNPAAERLFDRESVALNGLNVDTLFRDFSFARAMKREDSEAEEFVGIRRDGSQFPVEISTSCWDTQHGRQAGFIVRDITQRAAELERIRYLAEVDTLTGVANRNSFQKHLVACLGSLSGGDKAVALLLFDLDHFKEINDTLGHLLGDKVLHAVARRIQSALSSEHLLARLGGDEFAVTITANREETGEIANSVAETIVGLFTKEPLVVGNRRLSVGASIGIAVADKAGANVEADATELMSNADLALYRAKSDGRGRFNLFEDQYRTQLESRLSLERDLEKAIRNEEFELFYQPQVNLRTGATVGVEALIRWRHPERGLVPPGVFMPVVNTTELSNKVATWVIETACRQGAAWQRAGFNIRMGVNLAPSLFQNFDLAGFISDVLAQTKLSPSLLELEVTEDIVIKDPVVTRRTFEKIRESGVKLAFDDFGTGYGSLSYLRTFRLDVVKIDRSFVANLPNSADDRSIVESVIGLGHQLGLSIIAEGIEDATTVEALRRLGCDEAQGYYFGKPMSKADFELRCAQEQARNSVAGA